MAVGVGVVVVQIDLRFQPIAVGVADVTVLGNPVVIIVIERIVAIRQTVGVVVILIRIATGAQRPTRRAAT